MTLKEYLKSQNIRLLDMSAKTGLAISWLSEIANGRKRASMEAAIRIHRATGGLVTFNDLVAEELSQCPSERAGQAATSAPVEVA